MIDHPSCSSIEPLPHFLWKFGYVFIEPLIAPYNDYTWDEMVNAVHMVINKESVDYIALNLRSTPLKTASAIHVYLAV